MENNTISFKSKIVFVNGSKFRKIANRCNTFISAESKSPLIQGMSFYTEDVRTCTAGGITDAKSEAMGFHIYDSLKNFAQIENRQQEMKEFISNNLECRGLLIGSKKIVNRIYSLPIFKKMKEFFTGNLKNVSIFEEHMEEGAESHIMYNLKEDTWYISTYFLDKDAQKFRYVECLSDINKIFKKVRIANGDTLYINNTKIPESIVKSKYKA